MSEVKPRFDGKGSEFGLAHRDLPIRCGMFDVDTMKATALFDLTLKNPDECFFEYRTNFSDSSLTVKSMFEIKYKETPEVLKNMAITVGTSLWAQTKVAEKLECRFFYVIANENRPPFKFYEYLDGKLEFIGVLDYTKENRKENINEFWVMIGLLEA